MMGDMALCGEAPFFSDSTANLSTIKVPPPFLLSGGPLSIVFSFFLFGVVASS